jgi:adsorption protein B
MYNYHVPERFEMAQLPVFPLEEKPWRGWVRNTYIDEFCESHLKDMTIRQAMGGVVPSAGVGTAFDRKSLDELARENGGSPFQADSLTEDYMAGLEFSRMKKRTAFLNQPLAPSKNAPPLRDRTRIVSVREYFPESMAASVRQRGRWVLGIVFQSWERCGWFGGVAQRYTLYRDRRSPLIHSLNLIGYVMLIYIICRWLVVSAGLATRESFPSLFLGQHHLWALTMAAMVLLLYRFSMKSLCVYHVYGPLQALFCLARYPVANVINFCATIRAVRLYLSHKITGRPLAWNKTVHQFPSASTLQEQVGPLVSTPT